MKEGRAFRRRLLQLAPVVVGMNGGDDSPSLGMIRIRNDHPLIEPGAPHSLPRGLHPLRPFGMPRAGIVRQETVVGEDADRGSRRSVVGWIC